MERVVGDEAGVSDAIRRELVARILPGAAEGDAALFGAGVSELDRLNGVWYADEQDGVYDPSSAPTVEEFAANDAVAGAGQSSWGPSVYALTTADEAESVASSVDSPTIIASPDNVGGRVSLLR